MQSIVIYRPKCRQVQPWRAKVPVLILTGALNDINPPVHCHTLAKKLPPEMPVHVRVFPEARHGFDFPGLPPLLKVGKGRTMGYHPEAAEAAWQEVQQFLRR